MTESCAVIADGKRFAKILSFTLSQNNSRRMIEELQRRKDAQECPCETCHATGWYDGGVCVDCLGQGVLLTREEYDWLVYLADDILNEEILL